MTPKIPTLETKYDYCCLDHTKIHDGYGRLRILFLMFSSEFPCLPQELGNGLTPFLFCFVFPKVVNEFHRQLWDT